MNFQQARKPIAASWFGWNPANSITFRHEPYPMLQNRIDEDYLAKQYFDIYTKSYETNPEFKLRSFEANWKS